jgi:hypothetical protein
MIFRGMLLLLQAGPWLKKEPNWKKYSEDWFDVKFSHPTFQSCLQNRKITVIWLGYATSQTADLESDYPSQTVESILEFNSFARNYIEKQSISMDFPLVVLDWLNLTFTSQTSNGFHGLSEVNLVKVYHILNVMPWLAMEK